MWPPARDDEGLGMDGEGGRQDGGGRGQIGHGGQTPLGSRTFSSQPPQTTINSARSLPPNTYPLGLSFPFSAGAVYIWEQTAVYAWLRGWVPQPGKVWVEERVEILAQPHA